MGYGYGLSATPLQIAEVYAAFANGGRMIAPTFVKGQRNEPHEVLDPKIAHEVMKMMQTVTEPGGTATTAAILGYHVAGKTGTARMASGGGYAARKYVSTFAGVVPVDNPRFAMAVVVSEPDPSRRGYYGGSVSGPVFHDVMQGALRLMDVPPDDIESWVAAQEKQKSKARVAVAAPLAPVATAPLTSTNAAAPPGAAR
jgi:cell division protein FtsI (penicillin-binding protein 3)